VIDSSALLTDLKLWVTRFENDLRERCRETPELDERLRTVWQDAKDGRRTAQAYEVWRDGQFTQAAVGWVLGCVFVRFLEDNALVNHPWIAAGGDRRVEAEAARDAYFAQHPTLSDRDYLEHVFTEAGRLPGLAALFDRRHNPLWLVGISGDVAAEFIAFWRAMRHDFADPAWGTRFLGDLYQDLSEHAKKTYALLQTPEFIEEFILDRTLDPAIDIFGYERVRMIDPTCGSGHFLLGGFLRLLRLWRQGHPEMNEREIAKHALTGIAGVDVNPFAVAIARFRLLLAAWRACGIERLKAAPNFEVNLAVGDSLLHGRRFREFEGTAVEQTFGTEDFPDELKHHYEVEDVEALHRILGHQYHAVVGNPPYIAVKDRALSELYRVRYPSCRGKYSLSVPFMERFFDLAVKGDGTPRQPAGFVGQITANSFMKREFGKKLIEEYIPRWDLTHVIDTDKAHIPGHGTGTVILFGKNQPPCASTLRVVMGIKKQEPTPVMAESGLVWLAILQQIDLPGSQSDWLSVADSQRESFHHHPWSIGGGGAAELKEQLDESCDATLAHFVETKRGASNIGFMSITGEDEAFVGSFEHWRRRGVQSRPFAIGDSVREWTIKTGEAVAFPYEETRDKSTNVASLSPWLIEAHPEFLRTVWPLRNNLSKRLMFGKTVTEHGLNWWEYIFFLSDRYFSFLRIALGEVATHNHFVLDRVGKVFKQTAPVIKLKTEATEADHIKLLGVLNSSTTCFWLRQVCHDKGGGGIGGGIASEPWEHRFAFNATQIATLSIPARQPTQLPTLLVQTSTAQQDQTPTATLASWGGPGSGDLRACLARAHDAWENSRRQMIAWQEELDWQIYRAYGLITEADRLEWPEERLAELPPLNLGERTFEIFMVRQMNRGTLETTWFERHKAAGSRQITEPPQDWPADYLDLFHRRVAAMQENPNLALIERPEYKRRWNTEPWEAQQTRALRDWLLLRLESVFFDADRMHPEGYEAPATSFSAAREPRLVSVRQLADAVSTDPAFLEVATGYRDRTDFDLAALVAELVTAESVPFLPIQRYRDSGLRKRRIWERTWNLQREEDRIEAEVRRDAAANGPATEDEIKARIRKAQQEKLGDIPVPPKYGSTDFRRKDWWRLRDKLDVPKERWVLYPGAERAADTSAVIAWAGWDHKQQAQALAACYQERKDQEGWEADRLLPLLAGLHDLVPWLKQWHNDLDPEFQLHLGDFYESFVAQELHSFGLTEADLERVRIGE